MCLCSFVRRAYRTHKKFSMFVFACVAYRVVEPIFRSENFGESIFWAQPELNANVVVRVRPENARVYTVYVLASTRKRRRRNDADLWNPCASSHSQFYRVRTESIVHADNNRSIRRFRAEFGAQHEMRLCHRMRAQ